MTDAGTSTKAWTEERVFGRGIPFIPEAAKKVRELLAGGVRTVVLEIRDIPEEDFLNPVPILGYLTEEGQNFVEEVQEDKDKIGWKIALKKVFSFASLKGVLCAGS